MLVDALRRYLLENEHRVTMSLSPNGEMEERQLAEERATLDAAKEKFSSAELEVFACLLACLFVCLIVNNHC